jgi:hypothetical protein
MFRGVFWWTQEYNAFFSFIHRSQYFSSGSQGLLVGCHITPLTSENIYMVELVLVLKIHEIFTIRCQATNSQSNMSKIPWFCVQRVMSLTNIFCLPSY